MLYRVHELTGFELTTLVVIGTYDHDHDAPYLNVSFYTDCQIENNKNMLFFSLMHYMYICILFLVNYSLS